MKPSIEHTLKAIEDLFEGATHGLRPMDQKEAEAARRLIIRFVQRAADDMRVTPAVRKLLDELAREAA